MEEAPRWTSTGSTRSTRSTTWAEQFVDLGRPAEGSPLRRAVGNAAGAARGASGATAPALDLAKGLSTSGPSCDTPANHPRHGQASARAREVLAPLADAAPADAETRGQLGAILDGEALVPADEGRPAEAIPILRRTVAALKPAGVAS